MSKICPICKYDNPPVAIAHDGKTGDPIYLCEKCCTMFTDKDVLFKHFSVEM